MTTPAAALAVPPSILDTDLYKLSMQQAVWKTFPSVNAVYRFTNRGSTLFSRQCVERFRTAVSHFSFLSLTQEEHEWLSKTCPFLTPDYLDYLSSYRFKPEQVEITFNPSDGDANRGLIEMRIEGPWVDTILWEVPLMAALSETYFQTVDRDWDYEGQEDLAYSKGTTLLNARCAFSEFGTRRRRSFKTQDLVVAALVRAAKDYGEGKGKLTGTSNVHLARLYGLTPIGTIAHEWFMGVAALSGYEDANGRALDIWEEVYQKGTPLIALTDTFTSQVFFRVTRSSFAPRVKAFYEGIGIDPKEKLIVFSDSLSTEKSVKLRGTCTELGLEKVSFGIGTHFTNDFKKVSSGKQEKSKALNMVIKLADVDGKPCIKLSDDLTKHTGDKVTLDYVNVLYNLPKHA
ncbi:nicotinate phosphoribosyltransferase [Coprinellus micaceus]|uniref:nicotinate phosphoribosyltransferase n=1 Tax=Coprinellus micaceus TaxID=71717 RepID=A0A4Y7STC6_COPMI|nr:nicotinate phosphoribosyltransferase [Coprinellus micaceus]